MRITADRFPLPSWSGELARVVRELERGPGFMVLRGIPVGRYRPTEREHLFWGLCLRLGTPVSQDATGHMLGRMTGAGPTGGDTPQALRTVESDTLAVLALRPARASLASAGAVHNEVLARRPDLATRLYRPHRVDRDRRLPPLVTPLARRDGPHFSLRYDRDAIEAAHARPGAPPLTRRDRALFDLVDPVAADPAFRLDLDLAAGDLLLVDNHTVLHSVEAGTGPDVGALGLWLAARPSPGGRPASWSRGGVPPHDVITPRPRPTAPRHLPHPHDKEPV
nr:TauD/TfdA family dioxygenase [Streptomyces sp. SID5785]